MARPKSFDEAVVLEKARDLFWERGYTATSVGDLEKATGIRRSSLYQTFGDKRQLYDRTLAAYQHEHLGRLRRALAEAEDPRTTLKQLMATAARATEPDCRASSRGCYVVNATTEMANNCGEALRFVTDNRQQFVAILTDFLAGAQERGRLDAKADPAEWANYLFVCYNGLQVVVQTGIDREALARAVGRAADALPWA